MFTRDSESECEDDADALIFDFVDSASADLKSYLASCDLKNALRTCIALMDRLAGSEMNKWSYRELHFHTCTKLDTLFTWLYEAHKEGKVDLLEVYEVVQSSDKAISRLYLMVTIMGVFVKLISEYGYNDESVLFGCKPLGNAEDIASEQQMVKESDAPTEAHVEADSGPLWAGEGDKVLDSKGFPLKGTMKYDELVSREDLYSAAQNNTKGYKTSDAFGDDYEQDSQSTSENKGACCSNAQRLNCNWEIPGEVREGMASSLCDPSSIPTGANKDEVYSQRLGRQFLDMLLKDIASPSLPDARLHPATLSAGSNSYMKGIPNLDCLLKDITLMLKGIQEPVCGICLRNYYLYMLLPFLKLSNLLSSKKITLCMVRFVFNNFTESVILWVRLKHLVSVKEDQKLQRLYKDLHDLVSFNLYALSIICGENVSLYRHIILPGILRDVISCHEYYPQKYIMMAIVNEFSPKLHKATLIDLFSGIIQLREDVKVRDIIIRLLEILQGVKTESVRAIPLESGPVAPLEDEPPPNAEIPTVARNDVEITDGNRSLKFTPANLPSEELLAGFENVWLLFSSLISRRRSINVRDISEIILVFAKFARHFYPYSASSVYRILEYVQTCTRDLASSVDGKSNKYSRQAQSRFCSLLIYLLDCDPLCTSMFMPHTIPMLSGKIVYNIGSTDISPPRFCELYLGIADTLPVQLCTLLSSKLVSASLNMRARYNFQVHQDELFEYFLRPQTVVSPMMSPITSDITAASNDYASPEHQSQEPAYGMAEKLNSSTIAMLLHITKPTSETPEGLLSFIEDMRLRILKGFSDVSLHIFGALVYRVIGIVKMYALKCGTSLEKDTHLLKMLQSLYRTIGALRPARRLPLQMSDERTSHYINSSDQDDSPTCDKKSSLVYSEPKKCTIRFEDLRVELTCEAALLSDNCGVGTFTSEFISDALSAYEDMQFTTSGCKPLYYIMDSLYKISTLPLDEYHNLAVLCAHHCSALYKKRDKCLGLAICSHLFWRQGSFTYEKPQLVLQCLERALKIAVAIGFRAEGRELLLKVLQEYLWYYRKGVSIITAQRINSMICQINDIASSYRPEFYLTRDDPSLESDNLLYPDDRIEDHVTTTGLLSDLLSYSTSLIQDALYNEPQLDKQLEYTQLDSFMDSEATPIVNIRHRTPSVLRPHMNEDSSQGRDTTDSGMYNLTSTDNIAYDAGLEDMRSIWDNPSSKNDSPNV